MANSISKLAWLYLLIIGYLSLYMSIPGEIPHIHCMIRNSERKARHLAPHPGWHACIGDGSTFQNEKAEIEIKMNI
ncbi:MAG: hypothetical protein R3B47_12210 [Bacteroidia bacterium]